MFKGISPLQGLEGVLVIDPGGHGAQHEAQAPREAARVVLAQVKLDAVQCSLHCCAGEPARLQLLQLAQDQLLYLVMQIPLIATVFRWYSRDQDWDEAGPIGRHAGHVLF